MSVISLEGCAAILWKDGREGQEDLSAEVAQALPALSLHTGWGLSDERDSGECLLGGGPPGSSGDWHPRLKEAVERHLTELEKMDGHVV